MLRLRGACCGADSHSSVVGRSFLRVAHGMTGWISVRTGMTGVIGASTSTASNGCRTGISVLELDALSARSAAAVVLRSAAGVRGVCLAAGTDTHSSVIASGPCMSSGIANDVSRCLSLLYTKGSTLHRCRFYRRCVDSNAGGIPNHDSETLHPLSRLQSGRTCAGPS